MSSTITNVIMFIYLSFILYNYSDSVESYNIGTHVNEPSETATLTFNMDTNRTGFNITKRRTKKNKDSKMNRKSRTKTRNKGMTTPHPRTQRNVVNDTNDLHLSSYWTTDEGGHREQRNTIGNQPNHIVNTATQVNIRPEINSTIKIIPFTEDFKPSTKQDPKIKNEQDTNQPNTTKGTENQNQDTIETQGQDATETQDQDETETKAENTTPTHDPNIAEAQGQYTTETQAKDTTEPQAEDTTEKQVQDITVTAGQDTTEIPGHNTAETFRTGTTLMQKTTTGQLQKTTDAMTIKMFITQPKTESPDQILDKKSSHPEMEAPTINVTFNARQRSPVLSGLIWWVSVISGAGLGMIILLSILTILCYRPWRRNKLVQLRNPPKKVKENTYGKVGYNRNSKKLKSIHLKNSCYGKISEKDCGDDERYQRTQSVFSWGTEFESFETIKDTFKLTVDSESPKTLQNPLEEVECQQLGEYANNNFMLTQGNHEAFNNSSTSSAELLGDTSLCDGSLNTMK